MEGYEIGFQSLTEYSSSIRLGETLHRGVLP